MRPLKPFAIALGGLIASVFGTLFFGVPPASLATAPAKGVRADLQSKSVAPAPDIVVSRDAAREGKAPPRPAVLFPEWPAAAAPRLTPAVFSLASPEPRDRAIDQRTRLLVGVIELRI